VLVPKQAWAARATVLVAEAQNATERYAREAQWADRMHQTALRRRAYSLLAEARDAITHARRRMPLGIPAAVSARFDAVLSLDPPTN